MYDELHFFAEVYIRNMPDAEKEVVNRRGVVIGKVRHEVTGEWLYLLSVDGIGEAVDVARCNMEPTGRIVPRDEVYPGESLRVLVDPKTGEGRLAE